MKTRFILSLLATSMILGNAHSYSAETNSAATPQVITNSMPPSANALNLLVARIKAKLEMGKEDESDYADIVKDYDSLLAKYPKASEDRLNILAAKGQLYYTLDDPTKALEVFQQVKTEFPSIQLNGGTDDFLAGLKDEASRKQVRDTLTPGASFPDFNEKDLQDKELSIAKYKGKVILVDFWATWCPPCVASVPEIQKAYNKYHDKGFEVVGISLDEEKDALEKFVKQRKLPWPQHFDGKRFDGPLALKYGINVAPTTYLIGRDGKILKRVTQKDDLDKEIENALKKS
jgi:peroxiredoxin